jgi:hypothetical protein
MTRHAKSDSLPFRISSDRRTEAEILSDLRRLENVICIRLEALERIPHAQLDAEYRAESMRDRRILQVIDQLKASIEAAQPGTVFH